MGILNFKAMRKKARIEEAVKNYFAIIPAYTPVFTSFEGGVYESDLCRAAIHAFARHASKLKPTVNGSGNEAFERVLQYKPNPIMDTKKFMYRLATIYKANNTALIAPLYDQYYTDIIGFYPLAPEKCTIVDVNGVKYLRYNFAYDQYAAIEFEKVGRLTQYQYHDELYGENNRALQPTLELINAQNQGIINGVKTSASIRFLAKLATTLAPSDIAEEQKRFRTDYLDPSNDGGSLIYDMKYDKIEAIDSKPYIVNPSQMQQIRESIYTYFGCNEDILQNKYSSKIAIAYYTSEIEPFALESSLVMTDMKFSAREISLGNNITWQANRMEYLEPSEKLQVVSQLFDRGMMTQNQGLAIFNMKGIGKNGDVYYVRKEYLNQSQQVDETGANNLADNKGDDNNADQNK